jgi:hypothetical protein
LTPLRAVAVALLGALLAAPPAGAKSGVERTAPFGVVAQQAPSDADFEAMAEGGVGTYRWLVSWPALQADADGSPDWAATDRVVANLAEADIEPIPLIYGSPCFVVDCQSLPVNEARAHPPLSSPQARLAWAVFVGALVDRYGPEGSFWSHNQSIPHRPIRVWQIWNEQNAPVYYRPVPSPEGYAELLGIASEAIRSRDPDAEILLGGMFGNPQTHDAMRAPEFLDRLYAVPGARESFDGVAVHPYAPDIAGVERQIIDVRRVLAENGASETPIWITEIGWGTSPTGEGRLVDTVDGQAKRLVESFSLLRDNRERWNIAGTLWFSWRDTGSAQVVCQWCHTSGLIDAEGNPRPSWAAFAELAGGVPVDPGAAGESDGGGLPIVVPIAAIAAVLAVGAALLRRRRTRG